MHIDIYYRGLKFHVYPDAPAVVFYEAIRHFKVKWLVLPKSDPMWQIVMNLATEKIESKNRATAQ